MSDLGKSNKSLAPQTKLAATKAGATAPIALSQKSSPLEQLTEAIRTSPVMQARAAAAASAFGPALQPNRTGLPDALKAGVEAMSGFSMNDVRVTRNSPKPAQLQALAYAQGTEIHLGPGQERHLPHEAWHVVQQKQGRVKPTLQMKGVAINDDKALEHEADVMGARAAQSTDSVPQPLQLKTSAWTSFFRTARQAPEAAQTSGLVTIGLSPAARKAAHGDVLQGEFTVAVTVGSADAKTPRTVENVQFGERPNTQFGDKQEDHVLAWSFKTAHIKAALEGRELPIAAANLITIIDDASAALESESIAAIAAALGQAVQKAQEAKNELDLHQAIQNYTRDFLIEYNKHPDVTRKRNGPADKKEGARVRAAKNTIFGQYSAIPLENVNDTTINEFVDTVLKTFQFVPDSKVTDAENRTRLVTALHSLVSTAIASVDGGGLQYYPNTITIKIVRRVVGIMKFPDKVGIPIYKDVQKRLRISGIL
jgi:hypothetical protein